MSQYARGEIPLQATLGPEDEEGKRLLDTPLASTVVVQYVLVRFREVCCDDSSKVTRGLPFSMVHGCG